MMIKKQPLLKVSIYAFLLFAIVYSYYFVVDNCEVFQQNKWLNSGIFFYTISISLTFSFFINSKRSMKQFFFIEKNKVFVAIKIFVLSVIIVSLLELLISGQAMPLIVISERSGAQIFKNLIHGILVSFGEELSFKYILLIQILIRIGYRKSYRIYSFLFMSLLFALTHVFLIVYKSGNMDILDLFYLVNIFLYFYFTSVLFIEKRNFLLVVLLHFQVNIAAVFHNNEAYYLIFSTLIIALYTIPRIQNSWVFR
jgi:hypothetical protein